MITSRSISWWLLAFLAVLVAFALTDDAGGMAACQLSHSFDVCHVSLH